MKVVLLDDSDQKIIHNVFRIYKSILEQEYLKTKQALTKVNLQHNYNVVRALEQKLELEIE